MSRPAIFFDRDNTLIVGNDYLGDPQQVILISGAADAVARARALGYATVVVSNQSGVARGMFGEDDVRAVNQRMDEMLRAENPDAIIDRHEFCPFHPQAPVEKYRLDSDRRKPRPGMLLAAAETLEIDLPRSWLIGDAARDVEAAKAAGCRAILFNDRSLPASPAAAATPRTPPDFVASTLTDALNRVAAGDAPPRPQPMQPVPAAGIIQDAGASARPEPASGETTDRQATGNNQVSNDQASNDQASNGSASNERASSAATIPEGGKRPERTPNQGVPVVDPIQSPVEASIGTALARVPAAIPQPPPEPSEPIGPAAAPSMTPRIELLAEQILHELRRRHEQPIVDFSVSKLLAGITQVVAIAVAFLAYLNRDSGIGSVEMILLTAIFLQAMVSSLLIMSRQK